MGEKKVYVSNGCKKILGFKCE